MRRGEVLQIGSMALTTSTMPILGFATLSTRLVFAMITAVGLVGQATPGLCGVATGTHGAVAAEHSLASQAGIEILQAGGNAIDAAVAAILVTGVVNPSSSGLGGGGFMTVWIADPGTAHVLDYRESAPLSAHRDLYIRNGKADTQASKRGGLAVGVPGEPRGMEVALERWGTMSIAAVSAPAIRLADQGFAVQSHLARMIARSQEGLAANAELARVFLHKDGTPMLEGEILRRPNLAATLKVFAEHGAQPFYSGEISRDIANAVLGAGGKMRQRDLEGYEVVLREPLVSRFAGHRLFGMPPPSSGGGTIAAALAVLGGYDLRALGHGSASYQHLVAETLKAVFADRALWYGDPKYTYVPIQRLLGPKHINEIRSGIRSSSVAPADRWGRTDSPVDAGTTHISVVDAAGNAVAATTSVNTGFGAKLAVPGRDILLNNTMDDFSLQPGVPNAFGLVGSEANAVGSRKRPLSSMSPTIAVRDGRVRVVAGASGGPLIITSTLQTLLAMLVFDLSVEEAVAAPRIHHQWRPDILRVESGISAVVRASLERLGHSITEWPKQGSVQAVEVIGQGSKRRVRASSDPRKGGVAAAY
ncbi:MAG: gamma-glutamyltranspeptidase/glutathione hydrolase [Hyphomicrobiaceae bacterium]|jgi:gamma-glutamyltranspeptidase/glutathione hydrolase